MNKDVFECFDEYFNIVVELAENAVDEEIVNDFVDVAVFFGKNDMNIREYLEDKLHFLRKHMYSFESDPDRYRDEAFQLSKEMFVGTVLLSRGEEDLKKLYDCTKELSDIDISNIKEVLKKSYTLEAYSSTIQ